MQKVWDLMVAALRALGLILRLLWVFFPGVLLLVVAAILMSGLLQGQDAIVVALESRWRGPFIIVGLVFWSTVTWYSSRLIAYNKDDIFLRFPKGLFHSPRLLGYACFAVVLHAFLVLPGHAIGRWPALACLLADIGLYFLLHRLFERMRDGWTEDRLLRIRRLSWLGFALAALCCGWANVPYAYVAAIPVLQACGLFNVVVRRRLRAGRSAQAAGQRPQGRSWRALEWVLTDQHTAGPRTRDAQTLEGELAIFRWFNAISILSVWIYLAAIFLLPAARFISPFPIVLLALGVLVGFANILTLLSVKYETNLHFVFVSLVFLIGLFTEPHDVRTTWPSDPSLGNAYGLRPGLREYFRRWTDERKAELADSSVKSYPVVMAIADGGASRSGYWTAGVLARMEDESQGRFSRHLFCLSGASGGSVGNTAFFASLQADSTERRHSSHLDRCRTYLSNDFLSYTFARLLGPDLFKPIFPFDAVYDRAAALEHSMESVPDGHYMGGMMARPFSDYYLPGRSQGPALFINATRMQDGRPGVVSTLRLDDEVFGRRIDILGTLKPYEDLRLSSAVVLGARFPYISPAGRLGGNYFVDGGYFDNSGAGVVHEILIELQRIIADSLEKDPRHWLGKLRFHVIHARNSTLDEKPVGKVHPMVNDLAAPIKSLLGAYSTQTDVNNLRLIRYLRSLRGAEGGYWSIDLYRKGEEDLFPMNWVISEASRRRMDERLRKHPAIDAFMTALDVRNPGSSPGR
ncbi:MAG: patatin-like phospholipase family protein [Chitinophagia bacterium]|nr:patatin-like phospholipase family protein [Chitinophagia bacterium]